MGLTIDRNFQFFFYSYLQRARMKFNKISRKRIRNKATILRRVIHRSIESIWNNMFRMTIRNVNGYMCVCRAIVVQVQLGRKYFDVTSIPLDSKMFSSSQKKRKEKKMMLLLLSNVTRYYNKLKRNLLVKIVKKKSAVTTMFVC